MYLFLMDARKKTYVPLQEWKKVLRSSSEAAKNLFFFFLAFLFLNWELITLLCSNYSDEYLKIC